MVRLFHVYYPVRTLVLLGGEALVVCASFLGAAFILFGPESYLVLNYEHGFLKIVGITSVALLCSYYFDLYAPEQLRSSGETYFRLLVVLGVLSFVLAAITYMAPAFVLGQGHFILGLTILTFALLGWRTAYGWLIRQDFLRERVFVLGAGERARSLVDALRARADLGMDVVGWGGALGDNVTREQLADCLAGIQKRASVDRIIIAMSGRRGTMPVRELLDMRVRGVKVEEATSLLEKVSGKIEVEHLQPSVLIFSEGFDVNHTALALRRAVSIVLSLTVLLICAPLLPLIALAIKLTSKGPVLFRQERVGRFGQPFTVFKFRTMRQDAEAATGAVWAGENDPRITSVGRLLRKTRLDEIPQLWNVLKGDMAFVGPRPERPEFVTWLNEAIPYYQLRHMVRPGLTGWAQVRYQYGASLEQAQEKLRYDLYYIKNISLGLDLLIVFETVKIVLLRRGSQ
jgi:sugar transferase (PEP-CTERM system associated)